jgi:outer membrane protein with beta-barrel domain
MRVLAGAAALLLFLPSWAMADDGFIGLSYVQLEQDRDRFFGGDDFETGEVFARLGAHINEYLSAEMRLGTTMVDESQDNLDYRFNYHVGAYLGLGYRIGAFRPYLLAGFTAGEEEVKRGGVFKNTIEDVSYGIGADVMLGEQLGVNVEYTQYYDFGRVNYKGPSLGLMYQF